MKYILKDNKKFIITNALFEKINQNQQGSLTVNPNINNVVNKQSQQDKTLGNETQTNNQFDENNISDIFKKKWNINLDEEIKHTIIDYSNSLENRLVSLNKKIINFLSKKYPELQDSFSKLDIKEKIINELNTDEVNIHIKKALLQWFKNSNMNINNIYKDFNKSYPSGEKNINYDIVIRELPTAIKGGMANYLIEKLKETHLNTLKNSREIDNEDINHIIKAIIKEIGAGIFNKPGNMGDVMNIENIEKSENKDKIWEKFKSMFNELKKMNLSSYDDVYKELIERCIELLDEKKYGNIRDFNSINISTHNVSDLYKRNVKESIEILREDETKEDDKGTTIDADAINGARKVIYEIYNRYVKIMSETMDYQKGIFNVVKKRNNIEKILYNGSVREKATTAKDIILKDDETVIRYVQSFFDRYYNLKTHMFDNIKLETVEYKNIMEDDEQSNNKDEKFNDYLNFIKTVLDRFTNIRNESISNKLKKIQSVQTLGDMTRVIADIFSKKTLKLYLFSTLIVPFGIEMVNYCVSKRESDKETNKRKSLEEFTVSDHLKNFKMYMGRKPNSDDEGIYSKTLQELNEKNDEMHIIIKAYKEEVFETSFYIEGLNYGINIMNDGDFYRIKDRIKHFVLNNKNENYFMKRVFAYSELYEAYKKMKKSDETIPFGIKKLMERLFEKKDFNTEINFDEEIKQLFYNCMVIPYTNTNRHTLSNILRRTPQITDNYDVTQLNDPMPWFSRTGYLITTKSNKDIVGYIQLVDYDDLLNKVKKTLSFNIKPIKVI